jgi:hypothetical protein
MSSGIRPRAKFLTVVWGEAYIRRFATLSLPSFLAPGNLPVLAEATELEVVIMTRREDIATFEGLAAVRRLRHLCPVRYVEIDDLVTTGVYGVTLTLAFARPVIACGNEMLTTHFVFMNADFVLADGSLRALSKHILAGRSIVLGPSFRATAEDVEPRLEAAVDPASGILAIPPRQLARLTLPHPHPTTVAKIVDQEFCHSTHPNQFFWRVDEGTLLGRYYLIFMLCLRPERIVDSINCYCDYAFIPEMCPSGDEVAMSDSDEFFMLELQRKDQELHMLRLGRQTEHQIAASLSEWTTKEHRRAAGHEILFHEGDVPPGIETVKSEANAFVKRIAKKLAAPIPHSRHRYWIRGVEAWRNLRKSQGLPLSVPELAQGTWERVGKLPPWLFIPRSLEGLVHWFWSSAYATRDVVFGRGVTVTPFHPSWLDFQHLRYVIDSIVSARGARVLLVADEPDLLERLVSGRASTRFANLRTVLNGALSTSSSNGQRYSHALIYLLRRDCRQAKQLAEECNAVLERPGVCHVFIHHLGSEGEPGSFSGELMYYINDIVGWRLGDTACTFVGGFLKHSLHRVIGRLNGLYTRGGLWAPLRVVPLLALWLPVSFLGILGLQFRYPRHTFVSFCSSASLRYTLGSNERPDLLEDHRDPISLPSARR